MELQFDHYITSSHYNITCSATVAELTTPPVSGGLVTINKPSLLHSTMGNPMLSLNDKNVWMKDRQMDGQIFGQINECKYSYMDERDRYMDEICMDEQMDGLMNG